MKPRKPPLIGIPACAREIGIHPFHVAGDKYMRAVVEAAGGLPVVLPAFGSALDRAAVLERCDGLLFTGSPSNVEPALYGERAEAENMFRDAARDATTLPLIRDALEAGVPLLCICRGIQELNVALGGTLHRAVHALPGGLDHREDETIPRDARYAPAHTVALAGNGLLSTLHPKGEVAVNSLHSQGIARLGAGLAVEAVAPDGLIEAVRVADARAFALGVQWHPEWKVRENSFSTAIFAAFGAAASARWEAREG